MSKAKKTRFVTPYKTRNGILKPAIEALTPGKQQSGVYLIKSNSSDKILYIGYSEKQLYKTVFRHFQSWRDRTQQRFTYTPDRVKVRIIFTTPYRAHLLEKYLIKKLRPRDNEMKYKDYLSEAQEATAKEVYETSQTISADEPPF